VKNFLLRKDVIEAFNLSEDNKVGFEYKLQLNNILKDKAYSVFVCYKEECFELNYSDKNHLHLELVGEY
jgi:hypothetical protein